MLTFLKGDLTKKVQAEVQGEILALKNTINTMVDRLGTFATQVCDRQLISLSPNSANRFRHLGQQSRQRGRHGRCPWRTSQSRKRRRRMEDVDGQCQHHGEQLDWYADTSACFLDVITDYCALLRPGAQHFGRHAGHRKRRHEPKDQSSCTRRNPNFERHYQ